jgi:uncharacterized cupin superfamily protein
MSEQKQEQPAVGDDSQVVTGSTDHPQHRAPEGQGQRAPLAQEGADHAEMSIFDGAGGESVVVVTEDEAGNISEGTGETSAEAMQDAKKPGEVLGEAFNPEH